jgi:hypothetical protein
MFQQQFDMLLEHYAALRDSRSLICCWNIMPLFVTVGVWYVAGTLRRSSWQWEFDMLLGNVPATYQTPTVTKSSVMFQQHIKLPLSVWYVAGTLRRSSWQWEFDMLLEHYAALRDSGCLICCWNITPLFVTVGVWYVARNVPATYQTPTVTKSSVMFQQHIKLPLSRRAA